MFALLKVFFFASLNETTVRVWYADSIARMNQHDNVDKYNNSKPLDIMKRQKYEICISPILDTHVV